MYTVWRVCERLGLRPPNVEENFNDNTTGTIAELIAYGQIREIEEFETLKASSGAK